MVCLKRKLSETLPYEHFLTSFSAVEAQFPRQKVGCQKTVRSRVVNQVSYHLRSLFRVISSKMWSNLVHIRAAQTNEESGLPPH